MERRCTVVFITRISPFPAKYFDAKQNDFLKRHVAGKRTESSALGGASARLSTAQPRKDARFQGSTCRATSVLSRMSEWVTAHHTKPDNHADTEKAERAKIRRTAAFMIERPRGRRDLGLPFQFSRRLRSSRPQTFIKRSEPRLEGRAEREDFHAGVPGSSDPGFSGEAPLGREHSAKAVWAENSRDSGRANQPRTRPPPPWETACHSDGSVFFFLSSLQY